MPPQETCWGFKGEENVVSEKNLAAGLSFEEGRGPKVEVSRFGYFVALKICFRAGKEKRTEPRRISIPRWRTRMTWQKRVALIRFNSFARR